MSLINAIVYLNNKKVIIKDKITVGKSSGTNEYIPITQYLCLNIEGVVIDDVYPYFISMIVPDSELTEEERIKFSELRKIGSNEN